MYIECWKDLTCLILWTSNNEHNKIPYLLSLGIIYKISNQSIISPYSPTICKRVWNFEVNVIKQMRLAITIPWRRRRKKKYFVWDFNNGRTNGSEWVNAVYPCLNRKHSFNRLKNYFRNNYKDVNNYTTFVVTDRVQCELVDTLELK